MIATLQHSGTYFRDDIIQLAELKAEFLFFIPEKFLFKTIPEGELDFSCGGFPSIAVILPVNPLQLHSSRNVG